MFARIVELTPKPEMKDEILNVVRKEVLPILNKQTGFIVCRFRHIIGL